MDDLNVYAFSLLSVIFLPLILHVIHKQAIFIYRSGKASTKMNKFYNLNMDPEGLDLRKCQQRDISRYEYHFSENECDSNEEARLMAISMVPKITNRVIRVANKNPSASGRFYELPPPCVEIE